MLPLHNLHKMSGICVKFRYDLAIGALSQAHSQKYTIYDSYEYYDWRGLRNKINFVYISKSVIILFYFT